MRPASLPRLRCMPQPGEYPAERHLRRFVWLIARAVLHNRWKTREIAPGRVGAVTLILIALGVLGTSPPVWGLL